MKLEVVLCAKGAKPVLLLDCGNIKKKKKKKLEIKNCKTVKEKKQIKFHKLFKVKLFCISIISGLVKINPNFNIKILCLIKIGSCFVCERCKTCIVTRMWKH